MVTYARVLEMSDSAYCPNVDLGRWYVNIPNSMRVVSRVCPNGDR